MRTFLSDCCNIAKPYWKSSERWTAWGLLMVIIGFNLGEVYLNVLLNDWNRTFYDSLQAVDKDAFVHALIRFSYLAGIFIIAAVYKTYLNQMLRIKWRKWMTAHYLSDWLGRQNYYRMQVFGGKTDNPDQRISEDIEQFIQLMLGLSLGLLSAVVTLLSFLLILWRLSGSLDFEIYGHAISIPGYMVWVALVYAFFGTWITMKIGRPLVKLNFDQQRYEADFRFSLVRLRENSESVAFYGGEAQEQANFNGRFLHVVDNFWAIMKRQKLLNWFTSFYGQIAIIFPFLVASPRFFAKQIQLGDLTQTAGAFGQVQGALSYIIDAYTNIATWKAVTERLSGFKHSLRRAESTQDDGFERSVGTGNAIDAKDLTLRLPDGKILLEHINLHIAPEDSLLITGPSGSGKSTLLRTLAGLWPFAQGSLSIPSSTMLFLPQKPYLPLGTLRAVLCYPAAPDADDAKLRGVLGQCGLEHLSNKLDNTEQWSDILSLGEQQRLAFGRILIARPQFVFMDEATSALDEALENQLYTLLKQQLPNNALISIGHRSSLRAFHAKELTL